MEVVGKFLGLILPVFAKAGDFRGLGALKWVIHFLLVALILALLWFINWKFGVGRLIKAQNVYLRDYFLPILFVLIYALCWLVWMVWKLLGSEQTSSEFRDIDDAWEEGLQGL